MAPLANRRHTRGTPMTDTELVHLTVEQGIATVTLDSPHNRNALSRQLVAELTAHVQSAGANPEIRAIVLTHTGTTFCAGADLSEASTGPMTGTAQRLLAVLRLTVDVPQPVIARIDGNVRAGGVGLRRRMRHRGRRTSLHLRHHRGTDRARRGGHLGDRSPPSRFACRSAVLPHRRDVRRRRGAAHRSRHRRNG